MLRRIALMVALGVFVVMAAEVNAARRGGCPNGQCGYTYQPAAKVAVAKEGTAQVAATATDAAPATRTQYVASQSVRRPFFRRWAR